jgi:hypothetical protein
MYYTYMIKFMKQFSTVPNQFIDDFYAITGENYSSHEFIIDFNVVCKWLGVYKGNLYITLKRHFKRNIDFTKEKIIKKHKNANGATTEDIIFLTPLCFKELCMISTADNAGLVRSYYIALEDLMRKYHVHIEKALREKIGLLENNQKPKTNVKRGIIYFFEALNVAEIDKEELPQTGKKFIKMGKTENENNRFNNYNSGNVNNIEPLFILEVDDVYVVEKCVKDLLIDYQYRPPKEIYKINTDMLKEICHMCDDLLRAFVRCQRKYGDDKFQKSVRKMKKAKSIVMQIKKNDA